MKVDGRHFRSIWLEGDGWSVGAIDQRRLPHEFVIARLETADAAADAIRNMLVRGAPLIGATAAYGMALAVRDDRSDAGIDRVTGDRSLASLAYDWRVSDTLNIRADLEHYRKDIGDRLIAGDFARVEQLKLLGNGEVAAAI